MPLDQSVLINEPELLPPSPTLPPTPPLPPPSPAGLPSRPLTPPPSRPHSPSGITHKVRWTIPMSPQTLTVHVGDMVTFWWTESSVLFGGGPLYHNLFQAVGKSNLDACDTAGGTILAPSSLEGSHSTTFTVPGTFYYFCAVGSHCAVGQKLQVRVLLPPPAPPPTSPPPPAPPSPPPFSPPTMPPPSSRLFFC